MKIRQGRLNTTESVDEVIFRKVSSVLEGVRPYRLKVEAWALSQARLQGLNTPRVIDYYRNSEGLEVLLVERIYGEHLSRRASEENARVMLDVGSQMISLEGVSEGYGWINPDSMVGTSKDWRSFISSYAYTYGDRLISKGVIEKDYIQEVYKMIDRLDLDIPAPYLVHRDIKPGNIIEGHDGKTWIVDWENVILGDPFYDIAVFGVQYNHGILWEALVRGYGIDVSIPRYALYEIVALIGVVNFYQKYEIDCPRRKRQLRKLIQRLMG